MSPTEPAGDPRAFADAADLRRDPTGSHRWCATLDPAWDSPGGIHGGMLGATVAAAMRAELDDPDLALRTLSTSYRAMPSSHDLVVDTTVARRGGITAHLLADGRGITDDAPTTFSTALFTRPRPDQLRYLDPAPPDVPAPEHCGDGSTLLPDDAPLPSPPFFAHVELRTARGTFGWEPGWLAGAPARYLRWNRYRQPPAGDPDPLSLLLFADLPGAAVWSRFGPGEPLHFVISLEMTTHFLEPPRGEWVLTDIRARWMGDGYVHTETDLWCEGRLVAVSSQMMLARPGPPLAGGDG